MTFEELQQFILGILDKSIGIRDEQRLMANTAKRVGGNLGDITEVLKILFDSYLNQSVKTDSDVQFKSLQSPDFVTKIAGWIITALGDSEFRDIIAKSFQTRNFAAGPLGAGVGIINQEEFQTDKLLVRKLMFVLELAIQKIRHQGGILILSPASMKISKVVDGGSYWKCFFENDGGKLPNEFLADDQARLQNFNGDIKYLWSRITAIGADFVHLSKTDKDGEGIPAEGDDLVQLGNRTNVDRQDAVLISSVNGEVGIVTYFGINSFDLSGKEGSWFGKHGGKKGCVVRGELHVEANSSGLANLAEWGDAARDIQAAQAAAEEAKRKAQEAQDFIDNVLPGDFASLQAQIDGQIESFFYNYDPTLSNIPASSWTTVAGKDKHLNDTFTNTKTGASWRFTKSGSVYSWVEIADTATKKALQLAGQAQDTADSKRRVFVVTPVPPYEIGDLWTQGTSGDLMRCKVSRTSGNHVSSDWDKASKYTDDTTATAAKTKAEEAVQAAATAKSAADAAQGTANTAKTNAESANIAIGRMSDDNIISSFEKPALKKEWDAIVSEKVLNDAQATRFGVDKTAYGTAYNTLSTFIGTNLNTLTTDWSVTGAILRSNFKNYYDARTTLLNNISYNAKQQAAKAESDAKAAQDKANNLETTVGQQGTKISTLDGKYTAQASQITGLQTKMDAIPGKITQEVSGVIDWTEGKITETKEYANEQVNNVNLGTRNLITNRQNIITSGSDYPDLSSYSSVINAKGEREVTVTCIKINASWSRANRYAWYTDKLSKPIIPSFYVLSFDYKCSNRCRVSTCVRNNDGTSIINYFKDFDSSNGKWERGFFLINWTTVTTQYMTLFAISADCTVLNSTVSYRNLKLVRGNKGWDDSEAPEDVDKQIKYSEAKAIQEAQTKANAAKDAAILAANTASQAKIDLLKKQELAALDGKITAEEKRAIADAQTKYNNAVSEAQKKADAAKQAAISAAALDAQSKANAAKDAAISAANTASQAKINLLKTQELAALDGRIDDEEARAIKDAQDKYNAAVREAQLKADAAKKAAIDAAALDTSSKVDNLQIGGTNLLSIFNAKSIGYRAGSTKEGEGAETIFKCNTPGDWAILSISNTTMSIPVNTDFLISFDIRNTNGFGFEVTGTTGTVTLISLKKWENTTSTWKRFSQRYNSGSNANVGGINLWGVGEIRHIKIEKGNKATDWSPSLEDIHAEIDDVSKALGTLDTTINSTFKDGIINKAETDLIKSNINTLNAEKKGIDAGYTTLYNNVYLLSGSTAATNLSSAKTAYNTAHANLISSINTAISDGKATTAEKADVDAKFTAYGAALANYEDKVEAVNRAIQDRVKDVASSDITKDRKFFVGNFDNPGIFGFFLWKTTIPEKNAIMWKVDISGYLYGAQTSFGVQLVFYPYTSGLTRFGYMITGSDHVDRIRLGVIDGKIAIELKLIGDIYYPNFDITISATHGGNTALLKSYSQGWVELTGTIAGGDLLPITATNVVTVPQGLSYDAAKAQEAAVAAETADKKAQNAASEAGKANSKLSDWATDAKVNPSEKLQLKQQQANIQAEYTEISAQSTRYNLKSDATWTAYNTAYSNANAALTTYTAATPEFITIVSATWNNIAAYYPKRQAVLDKIAVAAKTYADTVANDAVDNLQIGSRNLFLNSGRLISNGGYLITKYIMSVDLVAGKKYTIALRVTTTGGQCIDAWMNNGYYHIGRFKINMADEVGYFSFTAITPTPGHEKLINFYNDPSTGSSANPATIKWAALYEGVVKPPSDWMPAPEDIENDIEVAKSALDSKIGCKV